MLAKMTLSHALALALALDELTRKYNVEPMRLSNGFKLMREGKAQYRENLDGWFCYSQDGGDVYAVDLDLGLCSCSDATNRRVICKHYIACWLTSRVESILKAADNILHEIALPNAQRVA